jgi:hypothetical protein
VYIPERCEQKKARKSHSLEALSGSPILVTNSFLTLYMLIYLEHFHWTPPLAHFKRPLVQILLTEAPGFGSTGQKGKERKY